MPKRMENGTEIEVNNADILVLQRVFYAMQDVCMTEERCQWEEDRMFSISQRLTGMGGGKGVPGGLESGLAAIERADAKHRASLSKYRHELEAAERILSGIENQNMRTFVILLYVMMVPGEEVRKRLNMTEYGFRRARRLIEEAESMAQAEWTDRYVLRKKSGQGGKNT